jgi:hypothetical protein
MSASLDGEGGVNSRGMLFTDAVLLCILLYTFWGGWVVTLAGGVLSILVARQPGRRAFGLVLAAGCLAPLAYALFLTFLSRSHLPEPETSDPWVYAVLAGLVVSVFAAPLAALVWFLRPVECGKPSPLRERA